jgi:hypothetical protein
MARPFFRNGRLVRDKPITKFKAQEIQQASNWTPVSSSNVGYICWKSEEEDKTKHGLGVWFVSKGKDGKATGNQSIYWYPSAPFEVYKKMLAASSKGKFMNDHVKPSYPHVGPFKS